MPAEIPASNPEKNEVLDDNALKFTLDGIDSGFLQQHDATSFRLTTDWLEMGESSEKKLARKEYKDGRVEMLLIQKFTQDGKRTVPPKQNLKPEEYEELLAKSARRRVEKTRYEFEYAQGETTFSMKYDEFIGSNLRVLEVDATSDELRESFDPTELPFELTDVTGQIKYYGYRVAEAI